MSNADVIAISDLTNDTAGAIVFWRVQGDTDIARLVEAMQDEGLDVSKLAPTTPSPEVALRRAVKDHEGPRTLVRPLPGGTKGFALVEEVAREDEVAPLEYAVSFQVRLHKTPVVELAFSHPEHPLAAQISGGFRSYLERMTGADTASWLCEMVRVVQAVALRDTGGVYFVPRETLPTWRKLVKALRASSASFVAEVPALRSNEAVDAILDSLQREASQQIAAMQAELERATSGNEEAKMGVRALETRTERCFLMIEKLTTYERILGTELEDTKERIVALQGNIAAAALVARAEENA